MPRGLKVVAVVLVLASGAGCGARDRRGRAVVLSLPYEVASLDPHLHNRLSDFAVLSNLYEPLVTTDAGLSLRPCLAERWDNPDVLTWVFHLRPGVFFHDGRPMTAADVVYSLERVLHDRTLEMSGYLFGIDRVRALSDQTVEVRTRRPMAILLNKLRFVAIVPAGSDSASLASHVDGTGPYELVSFDPTRVVLRRNDSYWGSRPAVGRVTLLLSRSPKEAVDDLVGGRADFVQASSREAERTASALPGVVVRKNSSISVKFLLFDVARPVTPFVDAPRNPFRDLRVRQAVDLAVDRVRLVSELSSPAVPAYEPVPPFIFGFDPSLPAVVPDASRARTLLADAGYPDGFAVTLHTRSLFEEAARALVPMLAGVGIRARVVSLADREFFPLVRAGGVSLLLSRFGCPTGDASDVLDNALHTTDVATGYGLSNDGGYSDRDADRLIEASSGELNMARRRSLLQGVMAIARRDLPWIPLYVEQEVFAFRDSLSWEPRSDNFVIASEIRRVR